jgi:glycosyltransferase involved in cell wall biosynthesis
MLNGKKIIVVLPAYNAAKTLEPTIDELPRDVVDDLILVDDQSKDDTVAVSKKLGIKTVVHPKNRGYGGNQKTCYQTALENGADIVVMLHPDYQYSPKLLAAMASMIAYGEYDCCLGSRILGGTAIRGGMPFYKYLFNRLLTLAQNLLMTQKLSEYHTGYRAFSRSILETLPLDRNSDDFIFDNQMIAQILFFGYKVGEISCPTRYDTDSSSISFSRSVKYGVGVLWVSLQYFLQKRCGMSFPLFAPLSGGQSGR